MTMERENSQNCYLNVRTDSENDLDALFNVVQSASKTIASEPSSNSLPMKMRNLPPSFFKQPARLDGNKLSPDDNTGLKISHSRAHSSPASLSIPTSSAGPGLYSMHQPTHTRTQSYDGAAFEESSQLPPGWEMRTSPSGQPYFMNHYEQVTTWQDPRKTQSTTNLTNSPTLPDGWEQAITPEGEIYYINHLARSTSWVDPRVAMGPGCRSNQQGSQPQRGPPPPHKAMLERVQLEQEQLKKRQQELLKQEILLKHGLLENGGTKSLLGNLAREASLGQLTTKPESTATTNGHIRDESFDSGLGMNTGGYNNYNNTDLDLNTANDTPMFDANYNTKDSSSCHPGGSRSSGRLPDFFDNLPGTNVDFGTIEDSDSTPSAMDTDDLGVGLDLPTDMLNDVESVLTPNLNTKMTDPNFLTWL